MTGMLLILVWYQRIDVRMLCCCSCNFFVVSQHCDTCLSLNDCIHKHRFNPDKRFIYEQKKREHYDQVMTERYNMYSLVCAQKY